MFCFLSVLLMLLFFFKVKLIFDTARNTKHNEKKKRWRIRGRRKQEVLLLKGRVQHFNSKLLLSPLDFHNDSTGKEKKRKILEISFVFFFFFLSWFCVLFLLLFFHSFFYSPFATMQKTRKKNRKNKLKNCSFPTVWMCVHVCETLLLRNGPFALAQHNNTTHIHLSPTSLFSFFLFFSF